jgi:hypothetical protein
MTSGEPPEEPDGEETEGTPRSAIAGYRLPERDNLAGLKDAVLFVPDGMDASEALNVQVWSVNATTMGLIIARRC